MGAETSRPSGTSSAYASAGVPSKSFHPSSRENELWLTARLDRLLDDGYIHDWAKRNDLATFIQQIEKHKKATAASAPGAAAMDNTSAGSSSSSSKISPPPREDHSEVYEHIYSFLGPQFQAIQSHRLTAIVSEVFASAEAATVRSTTNKRELFIRRIHIAIEHERLRQMKKSGGTSISTGMTVANPKEIFESLHKSLTPTQHQDELKNLPLTQQLAIRWIIGMVQQLSGNEDEQEKKEEEKKNASESTSTALVPSSSSSSLSSFGELSAFIPFFLHQLLPILDELAPALATDDGGKLGIMEVVNSFLMRVFRDYLDSNSSSSSSSSLSSVSSFPVGQVTTALLAIALARARFGQILAIMQPILLSHLSPSPKLDSLALKPQQLLKRIKLTEGPKLANYLASARSSNSATASTNSSISSSSVALPSGSLYAWGTSQQTGKLGFGAAATTKKNPSPVPGFDTDKVISVATFQNHVLLVDKDLKVYGFGSNENFRLSFDDTLPRATPTLIPFFNDKRVIQVSAGNEFSACLTQDGQVYCFGDGQNQKLGNKSTVSSKVPILVQGLSGHRVTAIACGGFHTLAVTSSNELFAWGKNARGSLGIGTTVDSSPVPIKTFSGLNIKQVACGWEHSLVLAGDGVVYAFGGGYDNKPVTGLGQDCGDQKVPKAIPTLAGQEVTHIACGWDHSLFVTSDGGAWACGEGSGGRLGCGDIADQPVPKRIKGFTTSDGLEAKIVSCDGGECHSTFVAQDGTVWSAGTDGTNIAAIKAVPTKLESNAPFRYVTCGGKITFGLSGLPNLTGGVPDESLDGASAMASTHACFFDTHSIVQHSSLQPVNHPETQRTARNVALMLLAQLDRLAAQQSYERDAARTAASSNGVVKELLVAPYCIEATPDVLARLFHIVTTYTHHVVESVRSNKLSLTASTSSSSSTEDAAATATARAVELAAKKASKLAAELAEIAACKDVHTHVSCDNCSMSPVIGARWKCDVCNDFDCKSNKGLGGTVNKG